MYIEPINICNPNIPNVLEIIGLLKKCKCMKNIIRANNIVPCTPNEYNFNDNEI